MKLNYALVLSAFLTTSAFGMLSTGSKIAQLSNTLGQASARTWAKEIQPKISVQKANIKVITNNTATEELIESTQKELTTNKRKALGAGIVSVALTPITVALLYHAPMFAIATFFNPGIGLTSLGITAASAYAQGVTMSTFFNARSQTKKAATLLKTLQKRS